MTLSDWAAVATILLAIEVIIIGLVIGAILFFSIRGMTYVDRQLRIFLPQAQAYLREISAKSGRVTDSLGAPIIEAKASTARIRGSWRFLRALSLGTEEEV